MDTLDLRHTRKFGYVLNREGVINVSADEYERIGHLVEKLYLYILKEQERNLRDEANGKVHMGEDT